MSSEENLVGVNPSPVDCPLVLMALREVNSYSDGVIQDATDGGNMPHGFVNTDIRTLGEQSAASSNVFREDNIRPQVTENGLDTSALLDSGNRIVVKEASHRSRSINFIKGNKIWSNSGYD